MLTVLHKGTFLEKYTTASETNICDKVFKMDQMKFFEESFQKLWSDMVCLSRPYHFKYFKGCLPQISLGHCWILCPFYFLFSWANGSILLVLLAASKEPVNESAFVLC